MQETRAPNTERPTDSGARPARLGIVGGGQLARMTALAAFPIGCEPVVLERDRHGPAMQVAPGSIEGDWNNPRTLLQLAEQVDVVTLENEFADADALATLEKAGHEVYPRAATIGLVQDKLTQKQVLSRAGLAVPRFRGVNTPEDVRTAGLQFGLPLLLKTRRNGYDGKGNVTLRSESGISDAWRRLGGDVNELLAEEYFPFRKELAVMVTRGRDGETAVYPVVETVQRNHVCHVVRAPADIPTELAVRAADMAHRAVEVVDGIGTFGVELFLGEDGDLALNEMAPRVHNSGHYTIEACECSQFENHVRAVLGRPLGGTRMVAPAAAMVNLLGARQAPGKPCGLQDALKVPGAHVHLYGKATCTPGRKMGHVTALGETAEQALAIAVEAARKIRFGDPS